jgi:hypothetical protein
MKKLYRRIIAYLFLRDDMYYTYQVTETGREYFLGRSSINVHYSGAYSLTEKEAYVKGKINLNGELKR